MTTRYLILAGRHDLHALTDRMAAVTGLEVTASFPAASILLDCATARACAGNLVLVGDAYAPSGDAIGNEAMSAIAGSSPADLLGRMWGRYVAVLDAGDGVVRIVRDPSGARSCYYRLAPSLVAIASDIDLLDAALPSSTRLDWTEISRILVEVDLRSPNTALGGTKELLPGNALSIGTDATIVSQCWSPWDHAGQDRSAAFDDYARLVRERVSTVVGALAAGHRRAVATVSGGLDSSIVALLLAGPSDLTCLTLATDDPSGDERRYARLVADATSSGYVEALLDDAAIDLEHSQVAHLPRPTGRPFLAPMLAAFDRAITASGATALFNGTGGDNVFCFLQSATPAIDRLLAGEPFGALATIGDIARMTGASVGRVGAAGIRRIGEARRPKPWRRDARFVRPEIARDTPGYRHPWLSRPAGGRIGTLAHITLLLRAQNYMDPWVPGWPVDVVSPLLAQPIVEACLSVPSWAWCRGGVDRAVARAAFADLLPPAIRNRSWKGGPDGFIATLVDRRRKTIAAMLVDGMLAENGLIDRVAVRTMIDDPRPIAAGDALRLLLLADAEAWVRRHG